MKELDLTKPEDCRWYVREINWTKFDGKLRFVHTSTGRRIELARMSDEDAIFVANEFFRDFEAA